LRVKVWAYTLLRRFRQLRRVQIIPRWHLQFHYRISQSGKETCPKTTELPREADRGLLQRLGEGHKI